MLRREPMVRKTKINPDDPTTGGALLGALLGGLAGGPSGAILGGLIGAALGESSKKKRW